MFLILGPVPVCTVASSVKGHACGNIADKASMTGQYLSGKREIAVPADRRAGNKKKIKVVKATGNNLQDVKRGIPAW